MDRAIKVKAFAVLLDASRSRHLVWVSSDESKQPAVFHRLLGGHVEFGENAADAVVREVVEELHVRLTAVTLLGVVESIYVYAGQPGHEVIFVYGSTVADHIVPEHGGWFDDGGPIRVEWRPVADDSGVPLYPEGTQRLVDTWIAEANT